jgi:hypothetical protein
MCRYCQGSLAVFSQHGAMTLYLDAAFEVVQTQSINVHGDGHIAVNEGYGKYGCGPPDGGFWSAAFFGVDTGMHRLIKYYR